MMRNATYSATCRSRSVETNWRKSRICISSNQRTEVRDRAKSVATMPNSVNPRLGGPGAATGMRDRRPVFMRPASIPRVLSRSILGLSLWPFLPFVVVCGLAGILIRSEPRVKDQSPIVLEYLGDPSSPGESDWTFEGGDAEWRKGHRAAAIQKWTKAAEGSAWEWPLPALLRVARRASRQGDQKQAIAAYKKVVETPISSPVNPPRPGELPGNSKYTACVTLSDIFLEQHDLERALEYAELAHDTHKFSSMSKTANVDVESCLQERINAIKSALSGGRGVGLEPRSSVLARCYSERRGLPPANPVGRVK
jgi:hypothetical protein